MIKLDFKKKIIIIDGGSKDKSLNIIKKYESYLDYWESKPDAGQTYAINKGVKIAETKEIIRKLTKKNKEKNKFKIQKLKILLEEMEFNKIIRNSEIKDQVREIKMWSDICTDLDDGTFNTLDPNVHQAESLKLYFENRLKALGPGSDMADVMTTRGMVKTANELTNDKGELLSFKQVYKLEGKDVPQLQENQVEEDETNAWARNK